tara:strand:+ start:511 stop:738 length:228 start_codon:yes stop_codon:yes gene_type:complete
MDIKINRMEMKVKDIGINWNLRYRLEKSRSELLEMKIDILRKRLKKYENYNTGSTRDGQDDNVIEFSRSVHPTGD